VMFVQGNYAVNVTKKDGMDSHYVVHLPKTLFGSVAKIVYLQNLCVDFQKKIFNNLIGKDFLFIEIGMILLSVSIAVDTFQALGSMISNNMFQFVRKKKWK
jgi:hypothetical protein